MMKTHDIDRARLVEGIHRSQANARLAVAAARWLSVVILLLSLAVFAGAQFA